MKKTNNGKKAEKNNQCLSLSYFLYPMIEPSSRMKNKMCKRGSKSKFVVLFRLQKIQQFIDLGNIIAIQRNILINKIEPFQR